MQRGLPSWTHGPLFEAGGVRFRLWAPGEERVSVVLESEGRSVPMRRGAAGFFEAFVADARAGTLYRFELLDGKRVPDPASRFQPQDVHGPSEIVDHAAYRWRDDWPGRDWDDVVLYELHLGAFTAGGTFKAAAEKLDHLAELGVTALEIMPLSDFPGRWGWGYDGVYSYAPDATYGRPEDFKAFVEAAHARGIAVLLDVVYNHFGPDGNYLATYAPDFFTSRHRTPWGDAINYDGPNAAPVRAFVIENAEYWIDDLPSRRAAARRGRHDQGRQPSPTSSTSSAQRVRSRFSRPVHLLLENDDNEPHRLVRRDREAGSLHGAMERRRPPCAACRRDPRAGRLLRRLWRNEAARPGAGRGLRLSGRGHGLPAEAARRPERRASARRFRRLPPEPRSDRQPRLRRAAERALPGAGHPRAGERLSPAPQTPMLFMGEEWGARQPFPYFCDFDGELAEAVRKGRREEFAQFPEFADPAMVARIPDPIAKATFQSAKLDWSRINADHLAFYRAALAARRAHRPAASAGDRARRSTFVILGEQAVSVVMDGGRAPPRARRQSLRRQRRLSRGRRRLLALRRDGARIRPVERALERRQA